MLEQPTELLVKKILEAPTPQPWSIQGFGMLRLYLSPEIRLHVWDSRFRVPNVSMIHNHPWDFDSYIVAGELRQFRYSEVGVNRRDVEGFNASADDAYFRSVIKAGPGGGLRDSPIGVYLLRGDEEVYGKGMSYTQHASEIHQSLPVDGTVTLVTRRFVRKDVDHAQTYWRANSEWVSAEPRPATAEEVRSFTSLALERWFK